MNHGKSHFTSRHGKIGLAACVSALLAAVGGSIAFRTLGLLSRFSAPMQGRIKAAHRAIGPLVLLTAFVNIYIGLGLKGAGPRYSLHMIQKAGLVLLGVGMCYLLWGPELARKLGLTRCGKSV